jgi:beta-glucosidase
MPAWRWCVGAILVALIPCALDAQAPPPVPGAAPAAEIERRVEALLAQMTLEEKVGQLNQYSSALDLTGPAPAAGGNAERFALLQKGWVGSLLNVTGAESTRKAQRLAVESSRLHIPLLFGYDVIHGYRTMFPVPLGEAASWDLSLIERSARVAATEAAAAGLHWTFAPMVDICRDARWGRVMEGAGEDPFLGAQVAAARVRGFQGRDLSAPDAVAACVKHFAGYGLAEAGRDYNTVDISEPTLRNVVLPPFKAAVEAGAASVMNSFNEIGGVPSTASAHLQRDILKGEWRFDGMVVSDWGSIGELVPHGVAEGLAAAARLALTAGSDMDMESEAYVRHLAALVRAGTVDARLVDDAARRVLRLKFRLGLFDDPYRHSDLEREKRTVGSAESHAAAREVARASIVLLKNDGALLPLARTARAIAVIGPLAADKDSPLGSWRAQAQTGSAVSLLEGIQAAVGPGTRVTHVEGVRLVTGERSMARELAFDTTDRSGIPAAVEAARAAEVVVIALGEDAYQTGEGRSQADVRLKGLQEELLRAVLEANPKVVLVLMNGRPLALAGVPEQAPAIVEAWHLGSEAGHAIADVLFGGVNPSGKLPISFPRVTGQLPLYYNHKSTGRPSPSGMVFWSHYTDASNEALFPFGFGLSYTTFTYSPPRLDRTELARDGALRVSVTLTNSGMRAGAEVVQLYVRDLVGSLTRPVKELKGFQKVLLRPGESREVTFTLRPADLAFYTATGRWEAEPGAFTVFVGGSSRDVQEATFTLR